MTPLRVAAALDVECSPCVVDFEVVIRVSNCVVVVVAADGLYLAVDLCVVVAFVDVVVF